MLKTAFESSAYKGMSCKGDTKLPVSFSAKKKTVMNNKILGKLPINEINYDNMDLAVNLAKVHCYLRHIIKLIRSECVNHIEHNVFFFCLSCTYYCSLNNVKVIAKAINLNFFRAMCHKFFIGYGSI